MSFRFVVIDDAAFLREVIKNTLTQAGGVFVGEADNGLEAIDVVQATLPDILTLDLVMPHANGLQIALQLKEIHPDLKILVCSTLDEDLYRDKAIGAGADDYISKPFSKENLIEKVTKLLARENIEWKS